MQCNMLEYAREGTRIEPHQLRLIWLCFLSHSHLHLKYVYDLWKQLWKQGWKPVVCSGYSNHRTRKLDALLSEYLVLFFTDPKQPR